MNQIDLHTHTTASDGRHTPTELVQMAADLGLRAIAVCDHDTTAGLDEAQAAATAQGIELIPAVELSCDVAEGELHMLGYFPRYHDEAFQAEMARLREGRLGRAQAMVAKLNALGYPITYARVLELADGGAVGRPHVAQALVEARLVQNKGEAFERLIGRSGPAHVDRAKLTPADACRLIRAAGGLPVFAHPFIALASGRVLEPMPVEASLPELVDAGLAGIEVYYPNYTPKLIERLMGLSRRYALLVTGGSDFHGEGSAGAALGGVYVPTRCLTALHQAHQNGAIYA
ncbi:MAG: PHP domain-containing protein [Caldilineales bacterium]